MRESSFESLIGASRLGAAVVGLSTAGLFSGCTTEPPASAPVSQNDGARTLRVQGDPRVVVPHAQRTIARTMPQFRRCFERMQASGKISLTLTIDQAGGVAAAEARGPVPREVTQCVESRALRTQFSSPEGGRMARLDVPLAVIRQ